MKEYLVIFTNGHTKTFNEECFSDLAREVLLYCDVRELAVRQIILM